MAKKVSDVVLDASLDKLATATRLCICSAEPANYAGIAAVLLGYVTISAADFTKSDGTISGRKLTFAGKSIVPTANGTANHLTFDDGTTLLGVTTISPSQAVTTSQTWNVPALTFTVADPT